MVDKLQNMIDRAKLLPPAEQEELVAQIETLLEQLERHARTQGTHAPTGKDLAGAWADLPDTVDEMFDALDAIRHTNPPSRPVELP